MMGQALLILQIIDAFEPVAQKAVMAFLQDLDGKSTEEILAGSDARWERIKAKARQEQGLEPDQA